MSAVDDEPLVTRLIGRIEAAATGSDGLLLDAPDERWCAKSTRYCGQAVVPSVLPSFLLGVLLTVTPYRMNCFLMNCFSLVRLAPYIQVACCPVCSAISWLAELVGVACWV